MPDRYNLRAIPTKGGKMRSQEVETIPKVTKLRSLVVLCTGYIHIRGSFEAPLQSVLPNRVKDSNPTTPTTRIGTVQNLVEYQQTEYESCRRHDVSWDTRHHESTRTVRIQDVIETYMSEPVCDKPPQPQLSQLRFPHFEQTHHHREPK
jgi:hypothetical protein